MHSAALTARGEVFTTGVNDEGALGRCTGVHAKAPVLGNFACYMLIRFEAAGEVSGMHKYSSEGVADCPESVSECDGLSWVSLWGRAAGELWEKSSVGTSEAEDSFSWARVAVPGSHGPVVQISAGAQQGSAAHQLTYVSWAY